MSCRSHTWLENDMQYAIGNNTYYSVCKTQTIVRMQNKVQSLKAKLKMGGVLTAVDVASVLSLEFVGSLTDDLGDLVGSFPVVAQLACSYFFGVLEDSAQYPVPDLESSHSDVLVVVLGYLLLVECSVKVSVVAQIVDRIEAMVEQFFV